MNNSTYIRSLTKSFLETHINARLFCEGIHDSFYGTIPTDMPAEHCHKLEELPISEAAAIGMVTGASMFGIKSIVCFQRVEFGLLAIDQLITNASKTAYLSCGALSSPFLLRMVIGRGWGQGPCHSQSFEGLWNSIPGLEIYMPATSYDYKLIFDRLITSTSPIVSLEHRWTHLTNINTSVGSLCADSKATVLSSSYNSIIATKVASYLSSSGLHIDVIHSLTPGDCIKRLKTSVKKTGRLITMDIGTVRQGIGGEALANLAEQGTDYLKAPIRLGSPFWPASAHPEDAYRHFTSAESLFDALLQVLPSYNSIINDCKNRFVADAARLPSDVPSEMFSGPF